MICTLFLTMGVVGAAPSLGDAISKSMVTANEAQREITNLLSTHRRTPPQRRFTTAEQWLAESQRLRQELRDRIFMQGAVKEWAKTPARIEESGAPLVGQWHRVRRFRLEVLPGTWTSMWLHEPLLEPKGKVPVVLSLIGHGSGGDATDPTHQARAIHLARQGLYVVTVEWFGNGETEEQPWTHMSLNHIDLWGTHGVGIMYLLLERSVDFALALPHADPARIASTGLSGGGWQALIVAALDERVTLAAPVAGFTTFAMSHKVLTDLGDSEQAPPHLHQLADYTEIASLVAPRPMLLTYNEPDSCCFRASRTVPLLRESVGAMYTLLGAEDQLRFHVNTDPGTHNYEADNRRALYRMLLDHGFVGEQPFSIVEDDLALDVRSPDELLVGLPPNRSLTQVAAALGDAAQRRALPAAPALDAWRATRQSELASTIDFRTEAVTWTEKGTTDLRGVRVTTVRARIGGLTVPVVVVDPPKSFWASLAQRTRTVIVLRDNGRRASADLVSELVGDGARVVLFDPYHFGDREHRFAEAHFSMLLASVGRTSLGIQASEVHALATRFSTQGPVELVGVGRRCSFIALVASALSEHVTGVRVTSLLPDFRSLSSDKFAKSIYHRPEIFVFGIAERFTIEELIALSFGKRVEVKVTQGDLPDERALRSLARSADIELTLR